MTRVRRAAIALLASLCVAGCARETRAGRRSIGAHTSHARADVAPACRFEDEEWWTSIVVDPGDTLPGFRVSSERAVYVPARGGGWEARVDAPFAFTGVIDEPALVTARAIDDGDVVHLEAGRRVDRVRVAGDGRGLVGRAWLSPHRGRASLSIAVEDIALRCEDLRVAHVEEEDGTPARPTDIWSPARMADFGFLRVRDAPGGPVRATLRGNGLFVHVLERVGDDALVVAQYSDGSRVRGWVEAATLREPERDEALQIGHAIGGLAELDIAGLSRPAWSSPIGLAAMGAGVGHGAFAGFRRRSQPQEPPALRARVVRGTSVWAAPGRGRWAVVTEDVVLEVASRPSCAWVAIERVPGVTLAPLRAWIPADALRLTP